MPIRMTGLASGLNTESIIGALMSAQRMKQTKVENKKTKLEWKQEKWSGLNTKIYDFYKGSLAKMKSQASYKTKAVASSDSSKVTATASSKVATGTYSIKIKELATAQYVTGAKLSSNATTSTKLVDLDGSSFTEGTVIDITSGKGDDAKKVAFTVTSSSTIEDFTKACTEAGLNATFDTTQQRMFIGAKDSGADNVFTITTRGATSTGQAGMTELSNLYASLTEAIGYDSLSSSEKEEFQSLIESISDGTKTYSDTDVQDQIKGYADSYAQTRSISSKVLDLASKKATKEATDNIDDAITTKTDAEITTEFSNAGITINWATASASERTDARQQYIDAKQAELLGSSTYNTYRQNWAQNGIAASDVTAVLPTATADEIAQYTFDDEATRITTAETNAIDTFEDYAQALVTYGSSTRNSALSSLGLSDIKADESGNVSATTSDDRGRTSMVVIAAKDSVIEYNGVEMTSSSTSMTIAGLQLNLLGTTGDNTINITVTNDIDSTYDAIKNMISDYNAVLKEMNTNYNAESARNYDVLSDDEKEAMSDDEVEKWEKKIKDSLLRRDTTLGGIISSFRNNMVKSYTTSSGKKYSLASLGITTSAKDYKEGGLLHIKGDEDDAEYAESTNTLKKMLAEDPDAVMETMTGILTGLYEDLQKKMKSTTMSSALTFYNDKEMASQLSDYKKQISTWESKLSEMEDRYYKQFAAMEKSLSDMQSQQNSLASYLS